MIMRSDVATDRGKVHVAEVGDGFPVLLLHQTPRSWDEYREVLPLLAPDWRAIAVDTPGFGGSDPPPDHTIEDYAAGVLAAADALGLQEFHLVGHHTGALIAIEVATQAPARLRRLVLSSSPLIDQAERDRRQQSGTRLAAYRPVGDGSHLAVLWDSRIDLYPPGRPDLLNRFVHDALGCDDPAAGHRAVGAYRLEDRLPGLRAEAILCVVHAQDPTVAGQVERVAEALHADVVSIPEGHVPLEYTAIEFAEATRAFLSASGGPA